MCEENALFKDEARAQGHGSVFGHVRGDDGGHAVELVHPLEGSEWW